MEGDFGSMTKVNDLAGMGKAKIASLTHKKSYKVRKKLNLLNKKQRVH